MNTKRPAEPACGKIQSTDQQGVVRLEANFENGERHGQLIIRYGNGNVMVDGYWANGIQHGPWKMYFENGRIKAEGEFHYNRRVGRWREWDIDGNIIRDEFFVA